MPCKDLHEQIKMLEDNDMLIRIKRPINKDRELSPLCRLQFLGLPENERKALLFENVCDSKGNKYEMPVIIGAVGCSKKMYAMSIGCEVEDLSATLDHAIGNPIPPVEVEDGPVHEIVHYVDPNDPESMHAFDLFPIPVNTPGFDTSPFLTCAQWVSQDPKTGERNVGNYRAHIKSPTRSGIKILGPQQDIIHHIRSAIELGEDLPVAIVIGGPPALNYAAATVVPPGEDEIGVCGAILGEPVNVVKCKTSDLMVPADAEIVFEGRLKFDEKEIEGPFGEYHGHVNPSHYDLFMEVDCVTYRKDAVFEALLAQANPTEAGVILGINYNAVMNRRLITEMGLRSVKQVHCYGADFGAKTVTVIQYENPGNDDVIRGMMGVASSYALGSKLIIAVDSDIDPTDIMRVLWAVGVRCVPHHDIQIIRGFKKGPLPPFEPFDENGNCPDLNIGDEQSVVFIDATLRGRKLSPVSLPRKQYMEEALEIWNDMGLPELNLHMPWYGYELGNWSDKLQELADKAAAGEYYDLDEYYKKGRIPFDGYYNIKKPENK